VQVAASLALRLSPHAAVSQILLCCFNLVTHLKEALNSLPFTKVLEVFSSHVAAAADASSACFWLNH
jgi:hypothetical protein